MLEVFVFFVFAHGLLGALPFKRALPETCLLIIVLFPLSFFLLFFFFNLEGAVVLNCFLAHSYHKGQRKIRKQSFFTLTKVNDVSTKDS